jgi:CspA family cold shock protein
MRFKKEQLYLLIFIVALTLAIVKTLSISGRIGFIDTLLLLVAGIGLGAGAVGIGGAMVRELTRPPASAPVKRDPSGRRTPQRDRPREKPATRAKKREAAPSRGPAPSGERKTGTVKWFNNSKGFGFISPDNGDKDCFVHRTAVDGEETLPEGARVEYDLVRDDRGRWTAANVRATGS